MIHVSDANSAQTRIDSLQAEIDRALAPLLVGYDSVVLFDFPDHSNVGDSAIFLGEVSYLRKKNIRLEYICRADTCDFRRLSNQYQDALILLHGGGNFGDLWPWHQDRRQVLIEQFVGRRIVQLPQTISFASSEALASTRATIGRHGNFTLLVRDARSQQFARANFDCSVIPCPDMAFSLGSLQRLRSPHYDLLLLLRHDRERTIDQGDSFRVDVEHSAVIDWETETKAKRGLIKLVSFAEAVLSLRCTSFNADALRNAYFISLAQRRLDRGLRLLSSGRFVITDRLHAYILAMLLDIPRIPIDNNYGKISGFIETWMKPIVPVSSCVTLDNALTAWLSTAVSAATIW